MIKQSAVATSIALCLAGCATSGLNQFEKDTQAKIETHAADFPPVKPMTHVRVRDDFYFGQRVEAVNLDRRLPDEYNREIALTDHNHGKRVALYLDSKVTLTELADLIQSEFKIPVRIDPYVYVRSTTLNNNRNEGTNGGTPTATNNQPSTVDNPANEYEHNVTIEWSGRLAPLLDRVAARLGISWEFKDGALSFYRFKTITVGFEMPAGDRTKNIDFNVAANLQSTSSTSGGSGGGNGTNSSGILTTNTSKQTFNFYNALANDLNAQRSPGAPAVVTNPAFGQIILTDTPERLKQQIAVINEVKRKTGRRGVLRLDFLKFTDQTTDAVAAQINAVITAQHGAQRYITSSPASVVGATAGAIANSILMPTGTTVPTVGAPGTVGDGIKGFQGSSAVINALMQWDKTAEDVAYEIDFRNYVPFNDITGQTIGYLASIGTTASQTATQTTAQLSNLTVGLNWSGTVRLDDSNMVSLEVLFNNSSVTFTPINVNGTSLQSPTQPLDAFSRDVSFRLGETVPISMLTHKTSNAQTNVGLGGSTNRTRNEETIFVFASVVAVN